jgi:LysM repeat protein
MFDTEDATTTFVVIVFAVAATVGLSAGALFLLRMESPPDASLETSRVVATDPSTPPATVERSPSVGPSPMPAAPAMGTPTPVPPTPTATSPEFEEVEYTVVVGDGVERIAAEFGISPEAIIERNNLQPPYILAVGQSLIIPVPPGE